MLEIERKKHHNVEHVPAPEDITITKYEEKTEYLKDGTKQIKKVKKEINLTKRINETKKLIKAATTEEKLAQIEKIFTK